MRAQISLAFLLAGSIAAAADDNALVGKWESVGRSRGGLGATLQLNRDGSLASMIGAMVDFTYSLNRGKLKTVFIDPDTGKTEATITRIRLEGDILIEKNGAGRGKDIRMTRLTPADAAHPIVGTWQYPHYTGATAFVTFTADGRKLLRIPLAVDGGSWVAFGGTLTLRVNEKDAVTSDYRLEGDVLTLTDGGKEFKYRRVRY